MNERIWPNGSSDEEPEPFGSEPPAKTEWVCGGTDILSDRHSFTDPNTDRPGRQGQGLDDALEALG